MKVDPEIQSLKPYVPGKPLEETMQEYGLKKVIKLASNENPLGPSPKVLEVLKQNLHKLHFYPDASFRKLKKAFSDYYEVPEDNLTFGNGSNELIDLLIRTFGKTLLTSEKTFIAYKICAQAARVKVIETPMTEDLCYDLNLLSQKANQYSPELIFIANPNNPTGSYLSHKEVEDFLETVPKESLVVLDEAYLEFVRHEDPVRGADLRRRFKNLVLLRTLSKVYGLAGLRFGVMIADTQVIDYINRVRNPFNVNLLAQEAAIAAIKDQEYVRRSSQLNAQGLDYYYKEFQRLSLPFYPSQGNFVLVDVRQEAAPLYEQLLKKGVIVRPLYGYGLKTHFRVSVGLPEENRFFIKALESVVGQ